MTAALVLGLLLAGAELPKLDGTPPAPPAAGSDPARRLPALVTVCRDRAAARCWARPGAEECPGAETFRTVLPGDEAATLAASRASLGEQAPSGRR